MGVYLASNYKPFLDIRQIGAETHVEEEWGRSELTFAQKRSRKGKIGRCSYVPYSTGAYVHVGASAPPSVKRC